MKKVVQNEVKCVCTKDLQARTDLLTYNRRGVGWPL